MLGLDPGPSPAEGGIEFGGISFLQCVLLKEHPLLLGLGLLEELGMSSFEQ